MSKKNYQQFKYSLYRQGQHILDGVRTLPVTKADFKDDFYEQCFLISEEESLNDFKSLGVVEGNEFYKIVITDCNNKITEWQSSIYISTNVEVKPYEEDE